MKINEFEGKKVNFQHVQAKKHYLDGTERIKRIKWVVHAKGYNSIQFQFNSIQFNSIQNSIQNFISISTSNM